MTIYYNKPEIILALIESLNENIDGVWSLIKRLTSLRNSREDMIHQDLQIELNSWAVGYENRNEIIKNLLTLYETKISENPNYN